MKNIFKLSLVFQIFFWIGLHLIVFISMVRFESLTTSLKYSICFITPLIPPVYLHSIVFEKYFKPTKYLIYIILAIVIILVFGYINQVIIQYTTKSMSESYLLLVFVLAMFTGFKYLKIGTKQQFQLQNEENRRIKAELDLLKSQINPHFMFNTLNSIYSLILDKDDNAANIVLKLSELMRYLLDSSKQKFVALKHECDFINNYIALEKIRLEGKCSINFQIEGELSFQNIAPMMLIAFVENCFKHGISINSKNNIIDINLKIFEKKIVFNTKNYINNKSNLTKKNEKTGLENIKKRLEIIYPQKHKLLILKENNFYIVEMEIEI